MCTRRFMRTPTSKRARRVAFLLAAFALLDSHATEPSRSAVLSCLSASAIFPSVKWKSLPTREINSQDDYEDGFNATYYLVISGKEIGFAEKGAVQAILIDHKIYPLDSARPIPGFSVRPTELNPHVAEWGIVADGSGKYVCVSFPFGVLGQSGSFQKYRSAYLISPVRPKTARVLFSATGNLDDARDSR